MTVILFLYGLKLNNMGLNLNNYLGYAYVFILIANTAYLFVFVK